MMATAAPVTGWLLVERPGPWGRDALRESRLDPGVASRLLAVTAERGLRIQVIRRPPDRANPDRARRWAYVDSRQGAPATSWWGEYGEDPALLDLSLDGSEGRPSGEPIFLVCTHARHDACCALLGRPVYAALSAAHPERTWETSHVGGDRFAANVVILPEGLYYGGLDADSAVRTVETHASGLIDPTYFRGRSAQPAPTQAAEHYLRAHLDEHRLDAVRPLDLEQLSLSRWVVRLRHTGGAAYDVEVSGTHSTELNRLTCAARHPSAARRFDLVSLRGSSPADLSTRTAQPRPTRTGTSSSAAVREPW